MWEKLSLDGSIHDVNNTYSWSAALGTKIASLNSGNFAGHSDWRVPNRLELETLVDSGRNAPPIDPAFTTLGPPGCTVLTCSFTQTNGYWSSTTYAADPTRAWFVYFSTGEVQTSPKSNVSYMRAVRGGL